MTLTGQQLIDRVRWAADIQGNTSRHTDADLLAAINQSIAQYRRMLSRYCGSNYQAVTAMSTVCGVSTITLPALEEIVGMQCYYAGIATTLHMAGENEQTQFRLNGRPAIWMIRDSAGTPGQLELQLFPTPNAVYTLTMNYIPQTVAVTLGSNFYSEVSGGEEWVVYDVAAKIAMRDKNPIYQALEAERVKQDTMLKTLAQRVREPGHRMDTRSQRRLNDVTSRRTP